jgi:hypothetical protein
VARLVAVERWVDELVLGDADRVDDDEAGLGGGVRGDGLEVGRGDGAGAAALHLLEVLRRADVAHEEDAFEGFDVGAGGDHVDGHGDPQSGGGAEGLEVALGVLRGIRDLGGEVVALAEDLTDGGDDLLGVGVVLGEDQRLGDGGAAGEDLGEEPVAEGLEDEADLGLGGDGPVELLVGVLQVLLDRL